MTIRHWTRRALPGVVAATLTMAGCGDSNPYGPPYYDNAYLLAGNYTPTTPGTNQGLRLSLGSRRSLSGRYDDPSGQVVRFSGTWERAGDRLFVNIDASAGAPPSVELSYARETILTLLPRSPFSQQPENEQNFLEADVMRLRGTAVVGGVQIDLDLARVITDVITIGGGSRN